MTLHIGLLHPGKMGAALGARLREKGVKVLWCSDGRSVTTAERAEAAGLVAVTMQELSSRADMIWSIVPPQFAEDVAGSVAGLGFGGLYVDLNAIRPTRMHAIAATMTEAGAQVGDACVIGPPPVAPHTPPTRLFFAGSRADWHRLEPLAHPGTFELRYVGDQLGSASALKIAQTGAQKLARVAAAISHALAAEYGVQGELTEAVAEWGHPAATPETLPHLAPRAWRWRPEFDDLAQALDEVGLPSESARAMGDALTRWERFRGQEHLSLEQVLDALTITEED